MSDSEKKLPKKIVSNMLENDPFSQWMDVKIHEVKEGYCKISCSVKKQMLNGFSVTHGGIVFALADSALAFSSATYGRIALSIDNSISFAKKTEDGDELTAISECIHLSHKTGIFEVTITNQNDELVAKIKGTVYRTSKEFSI